VSESQPGYHCCRLAICIDVEEPLKLQANNATYHNQIAALQGMKIKLGLKIQKSQMKYAVE
jgi:hypothetical protein